MLIIWGVMILFLGACASEKPKVSYSDLPKGDAVQGEALFRRGANGAAACVACHSLDGTPMTAPSLMNFAEKAGQRSKLGAGEYAYMSIIRPSAHVVQGYSNLMPSDYEEKLTAQQLADLVAYLLSL